MVAPSYAVQFLRAVPDPAVLLTPRGRVLAFNRPARVLLNLPADADADCDFAEFVGVHEDELRDTIRSWSRTTDPLPGAFKAAHDGAITVFNARGSVVIPADAQTDAVLLVRFWPRAEANPFVLLNQKVTQLNDEIRRRIQVEDALRRSETALQERVQEAEALNRAKDEFLATVSHELRTPLNAILGWSSLLRQRVTDPDTSRGIEVIHRNAESQARLVDDVLDVSRIVTGKMLLETRLAEISALVDEAVEVVRPSAAAKDITITLHRAGEPLVLLADPDRLRQALWNVCSNAVKFTGRGGSVEVSSARAGSHLAVVVRDTGIGIDPAFLPHVFDRFRQADSSTTRRAGGLGLGLALARAIVELHGGTIEAASPGLGEGATFTITLPVPAVADHAEEPRRGQAGWGTPAAPAQVLHGLRVLVVDDEPDARDLLLHVLRHAGADVLGTASAAAAFDALAQFRPHVLVSDISMPDESGHSLIRRVRALSPSEGGTVPAIALTAYTRPEDRAETLRAGFTTHVGKPVSPDALVQTVADIAQPITPG